MPDGKNESITAKKRRLFASTHFLTSKKRVGPAVHEEKLVVPVHVKIREAGGNLPEKSLCEPRL